jgi:hypothetical protein
MKLGVGKHEARQAFLPCVERVETTGKPADETNSVA